MRIAVIGGGINGAGITWELARKDYDVVLFERGGCGAQTSSATTKMIHGGVRYLEGLHFGLVHEALRDPAWLLRNLPQLVHKMEIILPIYSDSPRSRLEMRIGLTLYDLLAGRQNIARHRALSKDEILQRAPLVPHALRGSFSSWDGQVDDSVLVGAVVDSAARDGATIREQTPVTGLRVDRDGWHVRTGDG